MIYLAVCVEDRLAVPTLDAMIARTKALQVDVMAAPGIADRCATNQACHCARDDVEEFE